MRVMVFGKAGETTIEPGAAPTPEQLEAFAAMDRFNDELVAAGVFVAAAGLKNDSSAKRVSVDGRGGAVVVDGPFTESKEVVLGFYIWKVKDMDEALAWAKRSPMPGEMEIRPYFEAEDLGDFITEEEKANPRTGERGTLGVA